MLNTKYIITRQSGYMSEQMEKLLQMEELLEPITEGVAALQQDDQVKDARNGLKLIGKLLEPSFEQTAKRQKILEHKIDEVNLNIHRAKETEKPTEFNSELAEKLDEINDNIQERNDHDDGSEDEISSDDASDGSIEDFIANDEEESSDDEEESSDDGEEKEKDGTKVVEQK